ncbi:MAG: PEP-CTERM sorting domain-containing protein, partial [Armatimonadetes bacterium]|nr:PEP-CTERM sorting domain-containing protein [Armatimonadota bacterium]
KGTRQSYVDLHPSGWAYTSAGGNSESTQVGTGAQTTGGSFHALLWRGTPSSLVDLSRPNDDSSSAVACTDTFQVGLYRSSRFAPPHAVRWSGTAESRVDLHPAGAYESAALAIFGDTVVGYVNLLQYERSRAVIWHGGSYEIIHPEGFDESNATSISANGDIVGYGRTASGVNVGLLWQAVPEPSSILVLALGVVGISQRFKKCQ